MLIELGNHATRAPGIDDAPKITTIHIPEADISGLGGYTHKPGGIKVQDFKNHIWDAAQNNDGITHLPDHEILLSLLHPSEGAWGRHAKRAPEWCQVIHHPELEGVAPHSEEVAKDIQDFLCSYWNVPNAGKYFGAKDPDELTVKKELAYWTKNGPPGVFPTAADLPDATATYTNNGRVISNVNDGGGQVGAIGVGSAATSGGLTVSGTPGWASNQYAGYRIAVYSTTSNNIVWGNITANGTGANPSITVDRWYTAATPGGSAGTTPTTPWAFFILDGGFVSTWFVGLATGANAPAATDTSLSTNGNAEITTGGGGLIRKIAPYAQTSGVSTRAITLTPVYTANGSDSLPATVTTIGAFCSMVVGTAGTMKFETALNASATLSLSGDQLTVTETVNGS